MVLHGPKSGAATVFYLTMVLLSQQDKRLLVTIGDTIISINTTDESHKVYTLPEPKLPSNITKGQLELLKEGYKNITCISFSKTENYIVVSTENKLVIVFNEQFEIVKEIITSRAASKVIFTPQNDILLADKTGDVLLYKLAKDADDCELLLGHLSMLTDIKITHCGKYIITCDRDEKIRVSCYPNAYNIVSYCLGHTEFVTNVEICKELLISASGDGTVRLWDFLKGEQLYKIDTNDYIPDKNVIKLFCEDMVSSNVEVSALPVTDLQILRPNIIAVSVLRSGIQMYKLENTEKLQIIFVNNICTDVNVMSFSLSTNCCILTNLGFFTYKFMQPSFFQEANSTFVNEIYKKYHQLFANFSKSNDVSVFYKRKFDNLQEYLERKRIRLENKS